MSSGLFPVAVGRWDVLRGAHMGCLHGLAVLLGDGLADGVLHLGASLASLAPVTLGRALVLRPNQDTFTASLGRLRAGGLGDPGEKYRNIGHQLLCD